MKRGIFDLLMRIKARIFKPSDNASNSVVPTSNDQDLMTLAILATEVPGDAVIYPEVQTTQSIATVEFIPLETRYFEIVDKGFVKKIAYAISGNLNAKKVLLCLPGLLETKASFLILHAYFLKFDEYKVISIDVSGRGESDYICERGEYTMSLYLSEISALIQRVILPSSQPGTKITILGTSMGGVLAMYLTQTFNKKIDGIILNDIALTVNWTSLYALYRSMKNEVGFKEARELANDLSVDEKAIADVQRPGHFDLPYRADIWGMNFHEALEGFKGKIGLIYGGKSEICTKQRVDEAKTHLPLLKTCEVKDAGHPAPFDLKVCEFIQTQMDIVE